MNFEGKHIIVTGGANGIGKCITESFIQAGAIVTIIDIDERFKDDKVHFYYGDISEKSTLEAFVKSLTTSVDCLINNACISRKGLLSDCSYEEFEYVQRVGVTAPYYLTNLLLKSNLLKKGASIVNIASTRAFQSQADTESYSAAKGGIVALTHAMAVSLSGRARVNCISPGWIDTSENQNHSTADKLQHPVGRVGIPSDIAEMALYLCSGKAGFITGENITIDGGMSKLMIYNDDCGWSYERK